MALSSNFINTNNNKKWFGLICSNYLFSDDHNFVKLRADEDDTEGYVNASYIHVSYIWKI